MQYLLYILAIPFFYLNYKIVASDLKNKIIPNKYLGYLLYLIPFYYIYIFFSFQEINYFLFLGQILITFIVSFILYYYNIWAAGDAKYLLVLSLFIPYIGIIPFIGNISLITIAYLLGYFIYFYFGKLIFNKQYRQSLLINIKQDLSETWEVHKGNKGGNTYRIIAKFLLIFFIIFVSIRLSRIYLFNNVLENGNKIKLLSELIEQYNIYLIFGLIGIFIGGLYLFRVGISKFKKYISKELRLDLKGIGNMLIGILFIFLMSFISYELINNYNVISTLLLRVFTLYLGIYLIVKVLTYGYKITFGVGEVKDIALNNLREGDLIERSNFNKKVLPHLDGELKDLNIDSFKQSGNILLNKETLLKIKKLLKTINKIDKEKYKGESQIYSFNCLNTFAFGGYIFIGFIITYLFNNGIINYILTNIILIFKSLIY